MKLTDTKIRTAIREAVREGKQGRKLFDGRGLYLIPQPTGVGWWRFKYRFYGKEKLLSLGVYPDVSLKRAREKLGAARTLLADDLDPSAVRKLEKSSDDFESVAKQWLDKQSKKLSEETLKMTRGRLETWVFPEIGTRPMRKIQAPEILQLLRRIESAGKYETAHRVRQRISQIFRYAIACGEADRDPAAELKGALTPVGTKHHAAITDAEKFGDLLRAIYTYQGQPSTTAALKLLPLVFVRSKELRLATWPEFDLENAIWQIPASRMKMERDHIVPLSRQAVAILSEQKKITGKRPYVFEGLRRGRPISENSVNYALRSLGYDGQTMTAHGFRATARTLLDEVLGFPVDHIEHQLAHQKKDPNGRAYNRTAYLEQRQKMMQDWADYLDSLRKGADVVPIRAEVMTS